MCQNRGDPPPPPSSRQFYVMSLLNQPQKEPHEKKHTHTHARDEPEQGEQCRVMELHAMAPLAAALNL